MRTLLYGPPNWLVDRFSSEDRRMFGFWTIILSIIGAFFFGRAVLYVTALSIVALIPNFAAETPVETEVSPSSVEEDDHSNNRKDVMGENLEGKNKNELMQIAQQRGVTGVSSNSSKEEILQALKEHETQQQQQPR
jgi:hypothetical protein